jgi:glycosyltransferase involved in cell wall biosynthesis
MIFLCEHETQGMAYQEAMASGLPILAWDPGTWVDPNAERYDSRKIPACSVPFFDAGCGERFVEVDEFSPAFDRFWARLSSYAPRTFVREKLSLEDSGRVYVGYLERARAGAG